MSPTSFEHTAVYHPWTYFRDSTEEYVVLMYFLHAFLTWFTGGVCESMIWKAHSQPFVCSAPIESDIMQLWKQL